MNKHDFLKKIGVLCDIRYNRDLSSVYDPSFEGDLCFRSLEHALELVPLFEPFARRYGSDLPGDLAAAGGYYVEDVRNIAKCLDSVKSLQKLKQRPDSESFSQKAGLTLVNIFNLPEEDHLKVLNLLESGEIIFADAVKNCERFVLGNLVDSLNRLALSVKWE